MKDDHLPVDYALILIIVAFVLGALMQIMLKAGSDLPF